jgi:hypothetical protein
LRYTTRKKDGKVHRTWRLVRSVRIGRRVIQQTVTHLGELDEAGRLRARALARALIGEPEQADLFDDGTRDQTISVRLKGVRVENGRQFGNVYLALALWRACRLDEFSDAHIPAGKEEVPWERVAAVLVAARAPRVAADAPESHAAAPEAPGAGPDAPSIPGAGEPTPSPPPERQSATAGGVALPEASARERAIRLGLAVQFEERPGDLELGRLIESTVFVNRAHPAYQRAAASRSEGYHVALSVALALAPLAVEPQGEHAFVTTFLSRWGEAISRPSARRRKA